MRFPYCGTALRVQPLLCIRVRRYERAPIPLHLNPRNPSADVIYNTSSSPPFPFLFSFFFLGKQGIFIGLVVVSHTSNLHGQHDANPTMPQPYTDEQRVFRAHLVQLDELNETEESLSITSPSRSRSAVQPTLATARAARAIDATEQQSLREEWSGQCATTSSTLASSSSPSRRFELVLLSTYPRSGNSWTRALFRGSTLLDSRLTTVKGLDSLTQAAKYTLCSPQECSDNALGGYLLGMVCCVCKMHYHYVHCKHIYGIHTIGIHTVAHSAPRTVI